MKQYKLVNNLVGWLAFVIAAYTYCMTKANQPTRLLTNLYCFMNILLFR